MKKDLAFIGLENMHFEHLYPLISDNETLESRINRAGKQTSKAMKNGIGIYRDKKYFEVSAAQEALLKGVAIDT